MKISTRLAAATVVLALSAAGPVPAQTAAETLDRIFAEYFEDLLRFNPETATRLGRTDHNDRWSDPSPAGRSAWDTARREYLDRLQAVDAAGLSEQQKISRNLLLDSLRQGLEGAEASAYLTGFQQLFGYHTAVMVIMDAMPAVRVQDYEDRVARLRGTPPYIDGVIETLRQGIAADIVQPKFVAQILARQIQAQHEPGPDETPLLKAFRDMPDAISPEDQSRLREQAEAAYRQAFQPAWRKLHAFVAGEYADNARTESPVTTLPKGPEIYARLVKLYTTTDRTPAEIHQIGLDEVVRIQAEIDKIAKEEGFESGEAFEKHLRTTPEQRFSSKEEMLAYCRNLAMVVEPGLPDLFKTLPRMPVGIRPIPEDREAASASNYNNPAVDGTRPGWFNLKAYKPEEQWKFDMHALVLHETNPGHHLQIALQLEMEGLPEFRKIYRATAYTEGWALYAERYGHQLGVYPDAAGRFSALESERFRAKRLVVDTGIHHKGWTREQAIEYMGEEYTSEVERYIAWPGQALAYKMGQLMIVDLLERSRDRLGDEFDIREFHDVILRNGPLPLGLLEEQVEGWWAAR